MDGSKYAALWALFGNKKPNQSLHLINYRIHSIYR